MYTKNLLFLFLSLFYAKTLLGQNTDDRHIPNTIVSFVHDNDVFKIKNFTDQNYTFGGFIGYHKYLSSESKLKKLLSFQSNRQYKLIAGITLSQKAFTPGNGSFVSDLIVVDRPFAGLLTINPFVTFVSPKKLIRMELEAGVKGPAAAAGKTQNFVHGLNGSRPVTGWKNQSRNKALLNVYGTLAKPFKINKTIELISVSQVALGNNQTYLQQGLQLRIGRFDQLDNSGLFNTNIGKGSPKGPTEIFGTFHLYGRVTAVDASLSKDGVPSQKILNFRKNHLLAGYEIKYHMFFSNMGFTLAYHKVSPGSNTTDRHSYGSIGISCRW